MHASETRTSLKNLWHTDSLTELDLHVMQSDVQKTLV